MRKIYLLLLICLPNFAVAGEQLDSLFLDANNAYSEGAFETSIEIYNQILEAGFESPELYYNLGNASFRSNKLGYAILYYNKALKLEPGNEEAMQNLSYVSLFKEDELESVPQFFLKTWLQALFELFSVWVWSVLAVAGFGLILFGTITYVFAPNLGIKKMGFFAGLFAIVLFSISITGAVKINRQIVNPSNGIIISPSVVVKSTPSNSGTDLFVLHEGTDVVKEETLGEWTEIVISDGRIGWIPSNTFAFI